MHIGYVSAHAHIQIKTFLLILIKTLGAKSTTVSQQPQGEKKRESETEWGPHVKQGVDRDAPPSGVHF